ncbi:MAG TPA: hypothetical protein VIJ36_02340 [Thermoanaerobaculia bacterium]
MKKRLLFAAALTIALALPFSKKAEAIPNETCYEENYGYGQCATTCVYTNSQGSVDSYCTTLHGC